MLRLVKSAEPWRKDDDEPEALFWAFWTWLGERFAYSRREAPDDAAAASRWQWAQRAAAFDSALTPRGRARNSNELRDAILELRDLAIDDLIGRAKDSRAVFSVKDIVLLQSVAATMTGSEDLSAFDFDRLNTAESRTLRELLAKVRKAA